MSVNIPFASHHAWADLLTGKSKPKLEFLAASIAIVRLSSLVHKDPSALSRCAAELREIYVKNAQLPVVERDIRTLTGGH